ncbi:sugar ABC transporter ATP-binding protein [Aureimonas altamirensis]|uniref:sugar ABC transporter ATP-binding protein n=1 Tax=Aureimonas altamirensis TaxID=370622 RepID=UPI002036E1A8|nr:sugar ABC transporter ATP-binding protein [Aureimonas altamirensis]MCM2505257.1 sugar ABC transporter ATP-binding protein [Aureimonas altamirensis]
MAAILEATGVAKSFGAVKALAKGDLIVQRGEIHALLGANGCGKSTLCKVVAGALAPNGGTLRIDGQARSFASPREAERAGVSLFYQELSLIPQLSVENNIFLGHEPRRFGFVDRAALRREADRLIGLFSGVVGASLTPQATVADLSPDERQIVEILKVFATRPKLMIMDEATAALDGRQAARLFDILRAQRGEGVSTIMISHRLDEVFAVCDRITVMRNGESVAALDVASTDRAAVVHHMVGDVLVPPRPAHAAVRSGQPLLALDTVSGGRFRDVSLKVWPGEVVGLAGLQGQGQSALLRSLFGAEPAGEGTMALDGAELVIRRPGDAVRRGIAYVSGDRGRDAALHGRSIFENAVSGILAREAQLVLRVKPLRRRAEAAAADLGTRYASLDAPIGSLSGGNQQKIFIARWLATKPRLLLLDDPTKGIDLGAKADLFALMRRLADEGAAILFYSSEDSEVLDQTDRCLVFNGGRVVTELSGARMTALDLTRAAYGEAA